MDTDYISPSPECSFLTGIVFSLPFLQEGYQDKNGDHIFCFSPDLSDAVNAVIPAPPPFQHMLFFHLPYVTEVVNLKLGCMLCSYLLKEPHCCEKP